MSVAGHIAAQYRAYGRVIHRNSDKEDKPAEQFLADYNMRKARAEALDKAAADLEKAQNAHAKLLKLREAEA